MPPVAALAAAVLPAIGSAAAGAAGLASVAASAIGSVASGILGGATGLAGGAASLIGGGISALTGGVSAQAAVPVMAGGEMGSLAAASLGVPAATAGVATGLSTITSAIGAGVGIYGQLAQIEVAKEMTEAQKIAAQTKLMEAEAFKIYAAAPAPASRTAIPTLSQQPVYVTPAAAPAVPSYMIYIGLAIFAFLVLGKKIK